MKRGTMMGTSAIAMTLQGLISVQLTMHLSASVRGHAAESLVVAQLMGALPTASAQVSAPEMSHTMALVWGSMKALVMVQAVQARVTQMQLISPLRR